MTQTQAANQIRPAVMKRGGPVMPARKQYPVNNQKPMVAMAKGGMNDCGMAKGGMAKGNMAKVGKVMGEFKAGELHSGSKSGPVVKSRKQAVAIGMSEARKASKK